MTSATDRTLFDLYNNRIAETDKQRIDAGQSHIVVRYGMSLADARTVAESAHERWVAATSSKRAN